MRWTLRLVAVISRHIVDFAYAAARFIYRRLVEVVYAAVNLDYAVAKLIYAAAKYLDDFSERHKHPIAAAGVLIGVLGFVAALIFGIQAWKSSENKTDDEATGSNHSSSPSPSVSLAPARGELVSAGNRGVPGDADSGRPSYAAGARYVVFTSMASNLLETAAGNQYNIYRKDLVTGAVYLASASMDGSVTNGGSQFPVTCSTGRYIAFASQATNIFRLDNGIDATWRIYIRDLISNQTYLASANAALSGFGDYNPRLSGDCQKLIFSASSDDALGDSNGATDVYQYDIESGSIQVVSLTGAAEQGDGWSSDADVSPDGRFVVFSSVASTFPNAVPGRISVYLKDLETGSLTSVSRDFERLAPNGAGFDWPQFSSDGQYIVLRSISTDADGKRRGGNIVLVWDVDKRASAIKAPGGLATGWTDGCTTGTNNGTKFELNMSAQTVDQPSRVLFSVAAGDGCQLVLRDLSGSDIPIKPAPVSADIIEPALDAEGRNIAWVTRERSDQPLQVYTCSITDCRAGRAS